MNSLEAVILEQQRISLRKNYGKGNKDTPVSMYLLQMPSEKIASICVIQLMKTLFRNFITDLRHIQKDDS
jgi:DNA-directed RNA polymerase